MPRNERLYDPILESTGAIWIDSRSKDGTFEQLIATIGVTPITLVINTAESVVANLTIPSTIQLHFTQNGSLAVAVTKNIDIQTTAITAGEYPIFSGAGDFDFAAGTRLSLAWFASIDAAITYIGPDEVTLEILTDISITDNRILVGTTTLAVPNNGITITIANGKALTINGPFEVGEYRIFAGAGNPNLINKVAKAIWFTSSGIGTFADPWIDGIQEAVDSVISSSTKSAVELAIGWFEISSTIDIGLASNATNISIYSKATKQSRVYLADGSDCIMFKSVLGANQKFEMHGIEWHGNKANNTGANIAELTSVYNCTITLCEFRNSSATGLKLYTDPTEAINDGPTSINIDKCTFLSNTVHGIHIFNYNGTDNLGDVNITGQGLIEDNGQWGIFIENNRTNANPGSIATIWSISISGHHFEYNNDDDNNYGDIKVDYWRDVRIFNNFLWCDTDMNSIDITNHSRDCIIWGNNWKNSNAAANEDDFRGIRFDSTTRRNIYWGNHSNLSAAQAAKGNPMVHILDSGVNTCLDPIPNITRGPNVGFEDERYTELTGSTSSANDTTIMRNHIIQSEDLTDAAWEESVNGLLTVTQEAAPSGMYLPTGYVGNISKIIQGATDWENSSLIQDVAPAGIYTVKTGDLMTFSIFVLMEGPGGVNDKSTINIGVGKDDSAFEDFVIWDCRKIDVAGQSGFKRIYVTTVASENAVTIRCWLKPVANYQTLKVWGAQLNHGKMKPYLPTGASVSQAFPGLITSHLTAYNGVSLGSYSAGSGTTASLKSWQGKYQSFTHTGSITELSLAPGASTEGSEIVLKLIQSGAGARTLTSSTVKFIGGGAQNLTGTAAAVDIFTFGYSGSTWYQLCPAALDVK